MKIKRVSVVEVEYSAFRLAKELMTWNEPIPEFGTRFPNILESCLSVPFQTFDKKPLYKRLVGKAAILFYLMIKNHPFENGNKRIAIMTLLLFLVRNNKKLTVSPDRLYKIAVAVAESKPKTRETVTKFLIDFLTAGIR